MAADGAESCDDRGPRLEVVAPDRLLAFCHVAKVGGTTVAHLLRRHFGLRHLDVASRVLRTRQPARPGAVANPYRYGPADLRFDLHLYPRARSLAGHLLMPCVDFEDFAPRLVWYTFLREPIGRFRSQFLHEVEGKGRRLELPDWVERFARDDMTTRKIAGEPDLEAARQILASRMAFVGLQERFDPSLVLMRERLGLRGFRLAYPAPVNTAAARVASPERQRLREWALDQLARHADVVAEANRKDASLYAFVEQTIWPRQVAEHGGEERLAADAAREVGRGPHTRVEGLRIQRCYYYRKLVFEPVLRARLALRSRGKPAAHWAAAVPQRPPEAAVQKGPPES